jgi:YHS domain-containing protein
MRTALVTLRGALRGVAGVAVLWLGGCAVYNTTRDGADLMLRGHDPVSYFTAPKPLPGKSELSARHRYGSYRFATEENRKRFLADPDRYAPQYGAFCAKGVSYAVRAGGDPLVYELRDGRLFIFVNDYARDYWRTDPQDFVAKADAYWAAELQDSPVVWTNLKRYVFRVPHYKTYAQEFADYEARTGKPAPRQR